ncbi:adenylate/guanylate cyclase domain-containing protein [Roseibium sediminicola]|uniref:Adenylate/guanylate cyclase domain-containing protein n=1 Tax=Roseibium sediminicola TaxID=2933272 RepID=A0ABT0GTG0_9HYPH|nr:adenylate/guanylate cyclase domain-containing protein [Roseibium sp. CAU 1639]MCK7612088.1 adenylate/guanylate cyclase domain-containing protein [Roseibium sp. CAU 1639]
MLAALMVADAVGYSRRMEADEAATVAALTESRKTIDQEIETFNGTIIGTAGDSVVARFPSVREAVLAAVSFQKRLSETPEDAALRFRVGIHFGDVLVTDTETLGDGVNIAARVEPTAPPEGICISAVAFDQLTGVPDLEFRSLGKRRLKNIARPVELFCWPPDAARQIQRRRTLRRAGQAAAVLVLIGVGALYYVQQTAPAYEMPTGPRIAVMPFDEIGSGDAGGYFAAGLSRDISALLSEFSNLFVLGPTATSSLDSKTSCRSIASNLNADFILSGTVQLQDPDLRVTTRFMDANTCRELNAPGPFTRDLSATSILDVQLDIAQKVVAQIGSSDAPIFDTRIINGLEDKAPESLSAYECVLLSYWFYENFDPDRHRRARDCLKRAVRIDPDYALAWSRLAFSYIESKKYSIDTQADWAERSWSAAQKSLELDPGNPDAYYALAIRSQILGEDRSVFANHARKAIDLNPHDAFILADLGTWMAYSGEWEQGKEWVSRAKLLNPNHQSWWDFIWQLHAFLEGDYEASIDYAMKVNLPKNYMVQAALTAAYAEADKMDLARSTLDVVLTLKPDYPENPGEPFQARGMPDQLIDKIIEGVKKAGLPETSA